MNARADLPMGLVFDMPMEQYQAVDALSATGLRLLSRSPWHYRHRVEVTPTKPMLRGTLAHCAVLEADALAKRYVVTPDDAPRKPSKAQWAAKNPSPESVTAMTWWRGFSERCAGREIVSAEDYAITQQQLAAIARENEIASILASGRGEVSVFWIDEATGVYCKARPDWVHHASDGRVVLLDLKTTADESPNGFGRAAARMRYHLQKAHYCEGFERAAGESVSSFVFAAVTSEPPVLAVPYILTDDIDQQATDERRELLERFAWCKANDQWPAYGSGVQLLDFPAYAKRSTEVEIGWVES